MTDEYSNLIEKIEPYKKIIIRGKLSVIVQEQLYDIDNKIGNYLKYMKTIGLILNSSKDKTGIQLQYALDKDVLLACLAYYVMTVE